MLLLRLFLCSAACCLATPIGPAGSYNLFVFGSASRTGTDVEGWVAVGGNLETINSGYNSRGLNSDVNALLVWGNITGSGGELHHGSLRYGGTRASNTPSVPQGTVTNGGIPPGFFSSAKNYYDDVSTYYGALPITGLTTYYSWGGIELNAGASSLSGTRMQVFTVSGSSLASANGLTINAPNGTTVIVNVTGATASMKNMGMTLNGVNKTTVVFNFFQATSLATSGISVQGSILAPRASLMAQNGNIEGQVIVNSISGNGEIHKYFYNGQTLATPEPSTLIAGITGLTFLLLYRRKRST